MFCTSMSVYFVWFLMYIFEKGCERVKIMIIGGGIGGLAAAIACAPFAEVVVYEKAKQFKALGTGIGIGSNALEALKVLKLNDEIRPFGHTLQTQIFYNAKGKVLNTIDYTTLKNQYGEENITIHRGHLHQVLYDQLSVGVLQLNKECVGVEQYDKQVKVTFQDGTSDTADLCIAADGIHSTIRKTFYPDSQPRYAGYTCWRGIAVNDGLIDAHTSCEIWDAKGRIGYAPMANNQLYWFACINTKEKDVFYQQFQKQQLAYYFKDYPKQAVDMILRTEPQEFLHHDIYDIEPIARFVFDRIVLLGDAAHATTPNMGQGAGQAIEDAVTLANMLRGMEVDEALRYYEQQRLGQTTKVTQISKQIGDIAQLSNPILASVRNAAIPLIPSSLLAWRLKFLRKREL